MKYSAFIATNYKSLTKTLLNSLSDVDRELLFETIKRYNEITVKAVLANFNDIDFTGGGE